MHNFEHNRWQNKSTIGLSIVGLSKQSFSCCNHTNIQVEGPFLQTFCNLLYTHKTNDNDHILSHKPQTTEPAVWWHHNSSRLCFFLHLLCYAQVLSGLPIVLLFCHLLCSKLCINYYYNWTAHYYNSNGMLNWRTEASKMPKCNPQGNLVLVCWMSFLTKKSQKLKKAGLTEPSVLRMPM